MSDAIRVLVVDDDSDVRSLLTAVLSRHDRLLRAEFDVALVDVHLPDHSGLDILRWAHAADVDVEMIVLTGNADVETAVEAMRLARPACRGRVPHGLASPAHAPLFADDTLSAFSEQRAELIERRPRVSPARIIDFGSARARLRPLAAAR